MSRTSLRAPIALALLLCTVLLAAGCGSGSRSELPQEETRLKNLAVLYGQYLRSTKGKPPANVDQFKQFVRTLKPEELKRVGVEGDVDSLFISSRDNEPFVYRVDKGGKPGMGTGNVVFYEKTGKNGMRYVAYATTQVQEVDAAKFKELVPEAP